MPPSAILSTGGQSPIQRLDFYTVLRILQYATTFDVDLDLQIYLRRRVEAAHPMIHYPGRVCRAWHEICMSEPSMWRDIIYFINTDTPELDDIRLKAYLQRSAPFTIRLYFYRRLEVPPTLDLGVGNSVEAVLSAFGDHLGRVEVLVVETSQASSLPHALHLLGSENENPRLLPRLKSVVLTSNVRESILQPHPSSPTSLIHTRFPVHRALTILFVDGRNMLLMLRSSIYRMDSGVEDVFTSMPMLEAIGINNLTHCMDGFSAEIIDHFFHDILPSFPRLTTLALDNFTPVDDRRESIQGSALVSSYKPLLLNSLSRLIIKRSNHLSIEFVLRSVRPQTLVLIDGYFVCPLRLPSFSKLVLIDISSDFHQALPKTIARWDGEHVELHSCACIDEAFWVALQIELSASGSRTLAEISERPALGRFRSVAVVDCPSNLPT